MGWLARDVLVGGLKGEGLLSMLTSSNFSTDKSLQTVANDPKGKSGMQGRTCDGQCEAGWWGGNTGRRKHAGAAFLCMKQLMLYDRDVQRPGLRLVQPITDEEAGRKLLQLVEAGKRLAGSRSS